MSSRNVVFSNGNQFSLPSIPESWEWVNLKNHCLISADYGETIPSEEYQDDGIRFIRTTDIGEDGTLSEQNPVFVDSDKTDGHLLRDGDLLLSRSGTVGRPFVYSEDIHGPCSYASYLVRFGIKDSLDSRFFEYYCRSRVFQYLVKVQSTESTISNVSGDKFAGFPVPTPDEKNMEKIADFLDNRTEPINKAKKRLDTLKDSLKAKEKSQIQNLVLGNHILSTRSVDSKIGWIGGIPEHWDVVRTRFVAELHSGHTPSKSNDEYWEDADIPWVSLADSDRIRHNDYISETEKYTNKKGLANSSAHILPEGTVVFTRDATVGLCSILERPMAVSQHIVGWVCGPRILPEYLLNVLKSMNQEYDRLTRGSTISTIGMHDIEGFNTPLPPLEEQREIVEHIETETERLWELIDRVDETIGLLEEKRQALITAAVTGQIDMSEDKGVIQGDD